MSMGELNFARKIVDVASEVDSIDVEIFNSAPVGILALEGNGCAAAIKTGTVIEPGKTVSSM